MFGLSADKEKVIFRALTFDLCWWTETINVLIAMKYTCAVF